MTKRKKSVSLSLKGERWRVPLRPKTLSQEGREQAEKHIQTLREKKLSKRQGSKLLKIRKLQSRKGLLAARAARSPLVPLHLRLGAPHQPSLVMLTTRGRTKTDILPRRGEWTSPQRRGRRRSRKRVESRRREAAGRSSAPLPLGECVPGLPLPPRTPTTARAGGSTG